MVHGRDSRLQGREPATETVGGSAGSVGATGSSSEGGGDTGSEAPESHGSETQEKGGTGADERAAADEQETETAAAGTLTEREMADNDAGTTSLEDDRGE